AEHEAAEHAATVVGEHEQGGLAVADQLSEPNAAPVARDEASLERQARADALVHADAEHRGGRRRGADLGPNAQRGAGGLGAGRPGRRERRREGEAEHPEQAWHRFSRCGGTIGTGGIRWLGCPAELRCGYTLRELVATDAF